MRIWFCGRTLPPITLMLEIGNAGIVCKSSLQNGMPELDAAAAAAAELPPETTAEAAAGTPNSCVNWSILRPAESFRDQSSLRHNMVKSVVFAMTWEILSWPAATILVDRCMRTETGSLRFIESSVGHIRNGKMDAAGTKKI